MTPPGRALARPFARAATQDAFRAVIPSPTGGIGMFAHNKRLQYTVRVSEPNPGLANLMLEQFGGPQGELAAAMRYFTQAVSEDDPGRKDMLFDIATEELSHLEVIGHIVAMLNKGAKGDLAEAVDSEADLYKKIRGAGNDSHVTQVLYGAGTPLVNSAGVPWCSSRRSQPQHPVRRRRRRRYRVRCGCCRIPSQSPSSPKCPMRRRPA
jgi:hypothetical protein